MVRQARQQAASTKKSNPRRGAPGVVVRERDDDAVAAGGRLELLHVRVVEDAAVKLVLELEEDDGPALRDLIARDELRDRVVVQLPSCEGEQGEGKDQ